MATANEILAGCGYFEGVARNYKNNFITTVTGANTVSISTGGAMVDGHWYYNDAAVSVNIPSAVGSGNTRIDRIVIRCTWASYKAEIVRWLDRCCNPLHLHISKSRQRLRHPVIPSEGQHFRDSNFDR
jgi:hypothetical protein